MRRGWLLSDAMSTANPLYRRRAGILMHVTSLPGGASNGVLGADAYRFVDFLAAAGITVWQTLPVCPTAVGGSPYSSPSASAGNPLLIDLEDLVARGWLPRPASGAAVPRDRVGRLERLGDALRGFEAGATEADRREFNYFLQANHRWLEPYCCFQAIKDEQQGRPWWEWPPELRDRDPVALDTARGRLARSLMLLRFEQFVFDQQWRRLRAYANERGVHIFGDLPIFVADDSADVWGRREYFDLDAAGRPSNVAGVPPDYFSATGQRWGNPLYHWGRMAEEGFRWWIERMRRQFELFDIVRIDHFRGFEAYWEIPGDEETAMNGRWVPGPGAAVFVALREALGELPIVAEDLGVITPEVTALRKAMGFPGMKILQFAFDGGADNPYLPHNHEVDAVVYTGTHDNDTTMGWFDSRDRAEQERIRDYLGRPQERLHWALIRASMRSIARLAVVPMQDVIGMGTEARMNMPGTTEGNWAWRMEWGQLPEDAAARLRAMVELYGR
jgi:4-alpha-glucanotransferase